MQKVGGTAGALKIPFEEVSSWIAVISSRTRISAETVGQSVKSLLARVQSMREKGFDETDGTKVNQVAKSLSSVGIKLMDVQGKFRNFGTVMNELGGKWDNLDSRQKAYLATTVAGTYQQSNFMNLMEGYKDVVKLNAGAMESSGTASKKFSLYMMGTEAKLNQLKNTWQSVWMSVFKSNDLQNLIGALNGLSKGIQFVTNHIGLMPSTLGLATTAFLFLNSTTRKNILDFGILTTSLARTGDAMTIGSIKSRIFQTSMYNLTLASRAAGTGFGFLGTMAKGAFSFLATTALPIAIITGLSYGISKLIDYFQKQKQETAQLEKQQKDLTSSYSKHKEEISKLVKEYENLSNIKNNGGLDNDQQKQYIDIQNKLAKVLPTVKDGEDAKGNAVLQSSSAIRDQIKLLEKQIKLQKEQKNLDAPQKLADSGSKISDLQGESDKQKKIAEDRAKDVKSLEDAKVKHSQILFVMGQENEASLKAANAQNQINTQQQKNAELIKGYFSKSKIDSTATTEISSVLSQISLKGKDMGDVDLMFTSISKSVNDLNKALKSSDSKGINNAVKSLEGLGLKGSQIKQILSVLTDEQNKHSKSAKDGSKAMDGEVLSADQLAKKLSDAKGSFSATKDVIMEYIKAKEYDAAITTSQGQAYSAMSDKLSPINKMLEDLANGQTLSASAAMDLIQKVPELTKYLTIQNGQVSVNVQGIIDLRDAQVASFQDMINAEKTQIEAQSKGLKTKLANYGIEIQAILSVAQANDALAEAEKKHAENAANINGSNSPGAMHASMAEQGQYDSVVSGVNKIKDAYSQLDQLSSMASTGLTQVGTSIDKTSSSAEKSTYVTDKYKQSMESLTTALEKLKSIQQNYPNSSQAYRNALKQEIDLLKQQKDLTDSQASNLQKQISSGLIQPTGMVKGSSGGSSSSGNTANYASGGSTQAQVWNFLKGKGLSDSAIAGIMGNLQQESGFRTDAQNHNGATGIAQWMGGRLSNLKSQSNWTSLDTQLKFLWSEWSSMMPSGFNSLNPNQAATMFEKLFERSGGSALAKRQNNASAIYSQFAGSGGASTSGSASDASQAAAEAAQSIDQAKSDVLSLQQNSQQIQDQIQQLYMEIVNSNLAAIDQVKKQYDAQLAQYDYLQSIQDKNSADWLHTQMNREAAYNQQMKAEQQSIDYLQQEIKYNNDLTAAQKTTLSDDILQRQQDLIGLEQKLYDTRLQMANEIVDTYKQALTSMKDAATKAIDDQINAINKEADKADYKKKLSDAQKSAQDIQDEINKLMLDDSTAAKKRIADLKKQLTDQQNSIDQMVTDNNKQTQIDNLNAQKDSISIYYDNMLNDEQKFSQMRTDILKINNQNIINELNSLSTQVQSNVNILGTSVVNTLIDAINRANGYMGLSTANTGVIGHIASLDVGGMTPKWGSSGKLAVLHEEEMISNKLDTSNFLKSITLMRDFVANIIKPTDFSGLKMNPAMAGGGNVYNLNLRIDNLNGNKQGADLVWSKLVNGVKSLGGDI